MYECIYLCICLIIYLFKMAKTYGMKSCMLILPSRALENVLFFTYEVVIMSLSYSSALMSERIKCSIALVDNHINIHRAIHAVR